MNFDILTTVYIGNAIGIVLLLTMLVGNYRAMEKSRDVRYVIRFMLIALVSCAMEPIVYSLDGRSGWLNTAVLYIGNSWLFLANIFTAMCWVIFIANHLNIQLSKKHLLFLHSLFILGVAVIAINFFYPVVFSLEENVYRRTYLFWLYVVIAVIYLFDSLFLYYKAKRRGGLLKFFPVGLFLVPIFLGIAVQSLLYGISVGWTSVAIAMSGVMSALHNEIIFRDRLTGLFNRSYLDYLQKGINKQKNTSITGIMLDLDDFKSINDRFGHGTGDEALMITAEIFRKTVGDLGCVIRYAGDEFVILLNTHDERVVKDCEERIRLAMEAFNQTDEKPYRLSASCGHAPLDLKNQTMNDFMNTIDRKMYENKALTYRKGD